MKTKKGIFIPLEIWTIKKMTFYEKLVLSDMWNQEKRNEQNYKGYNKTETTLEEDFNISDGNEIFKSLRKKGLIFANSDYYRSEKGIKRGLPNRKIHKENLRNAERFEIEKENTILKQGKDGIYISYEEIKSINSWSRTGKGKTLRHDVTTRFLILNILIHRAGFYLGERDGSIFLCIRYNTQDLADFMGMTRQTVSKHCKNLKEKGKYTVCEEEKEIRILNNLEDEEIYNDIYNRYGSIATSYESERVDKVMEVYDKEADERIEVETMNTRGLYFVDEEALENIGLFIDLDRKIERKFDEIDEE